MIDCGVSLRAITTKVGYEALKELGALFITHEHTDHIQGIPILLKRIPHLPVYIHEESWRAKRAHFAGANRRPLKLGTVVSIGSLQVFPFETHHDAMSSHGFFINDEDTGINLCYIADTGHICDEIKEHVARADILFIECDYDEQLLRTYQGYSPILKERISGRHGHLSNQQALDLLEEIGVERFQRVIFAHLSPRTNSPEVLMAAVQKRFGYHDRFEVAGEISLRRTLPLSI